MIKSISMTTLRVITSTEIDAWKKLLSYPGVKEAEAQGFRAENDKDSLLTALYKYIPATVIIGYTFLDAIFESLTPTPLRLWEVLFVILLAGAGVLTYQLTQGNPARYLPESVRNGQDVQAQIENLNTIIDHQRLKQAGIAMIAFAGYVLATGRLFTHITVFTWEAYYGAVALVLATLAVAILVGKDILAD
jgi:hypothetical protein